MVREYAGIGESERGWFCHLLSFFIVHTCVYSMSIMYVCIVLFSVLEGISL